LIHFYKREREGELSLLSPTVAVAASIDGSAGLLRVSPTEL